METGRAQVLLPRGRLALWAEFSHTTPSPALSPRRAWEGLHCELHPATSARWTVSRSIVPAARVTSVVSMPHPVVYSITGSTGGTGDQVLAKRTFVGANRL